MEKIKFGKFEFDLVTDGYRIRENGGEITFLPDTKTFEEVEDIMKNAESILLVDGLGNSIASRTDLVYAGRLAKDTAYVISTSNQGEDVTGTVMIAKFRTSDLREELDKTNAKLDYVAMMADVEV